MKKLILIIITAALLMLVSCDDTESVTINPADFYCYLDDFVNYIGVFDEHEQSNFEPFALFRNMAIRRGKSEYSDDNRLVVKSDFAERALKASFGITPEDILPSEHFAYDENVDGYVLKRYHEPTESGYKLVRNEASIISDGRNIFVKCNLTGERDIGAEYTFIAIKSGDDVFYRFDDVTRFDKQFDDLTMEFENLFGKFSVAYVTYSENGKTVYLNPICRLINNDKLLPYPEDFSTRLDPDNIYIYRNKMYIPMGNEFDHDLRFYHFGTYVVEIPSGDGYWLGDEMKSYESPNRDCDRILSISPDGRYALLHDGYMSGNFYGSYYLYSFETEEKTYICDCYGNFNYTGKLNDSNVERCYWESDRIKIYQRLKVVSFGIE